VIEAMVKFMDKSKDMSKCSKGSERGVFKETNEISSTM